MISNTNNKTYSKGGNKPCMAIINIFPIVNPGRLSFQIV